MSFVRYNFRHLVFLSLAAFMLSACKKDEHNDVDNESQTAVDCSLTLQEYVSAVGAACYSALNTKDLSPYKIVENHCDSLRLDSLRGSHRWFSLNLGATCSFSDGSSRSGRLQWRVPADSLSKQTDLVLKFSEHRCGNYTFVCDSVVLRLVSTEASQATFTIRLVNGRCTTGAGTIRLAVQGSLQLNTPAVAPNAGQFVLLTGTLQGTNRSSRSFSADISPGGLKKFRNCRYISEGFMKLTPEGFKSRTINFGNGTCDDLATFSVKENSVAFKLK